MKVTIITIVYNNCSTIASAIESVLSQNYKDIEYIIIDGLSMDGTVEIVKKYTERISKFISEKDRGLYDALNKGIKLATGDIIGFLHSDDTFYYNDAIQDIVSHFKTSNSESIYADLEYVSRFNSEKVIRYWKAGNYDLKNFIYGWMPPHPTFYVKREVYEKLGLYDTSFESAADYELMLRYLYKYKISAAYLPKTLIKMRVGGKSNVSFKNRIKANNEDHRAWIINGLKPKFYTRYLKPLRKIIQYK
ncbi:glycosyltransferase involved in cell wall biosynthesis [Pontibacter aydingkolensis]|uniref:Glycosyltransferase n=1 Tax=Pontibacter aydingkolensis TaxID=1911536 RepID=A0ABS7CTM1_9BACT|nr:glycosyltransferase family 2 protein [Pontibacter aydingkolensis]MBW7467199.1 glycosyltransferase [Pontibacter aydingkolensis]